MTKPRGVKMVHATLRLIARPDEPVHIPITQDEGPMTEDMLERQLCSLAAGGDSAEAAQQRARIQSRGLRSDMMAFRAANPGAVLEDFIRWHSPRDWITEADGTCGLSNRMRQPGNLWQELWAEAPAVPVAMQRVLFDSTLEAERALANLQSLSPAALVEQLAPNILV
jgi:Rab3 GTPase-activating protein catalytic subunit